MDHVTCLEREKERGMGDGLILCFVGGSVRISRDRA